MIFAQRSSQTADRLWVKMFKDFCASFFSNYGLVIFYLSVLDLLTQPQERLLNVPCFKFCLCLQFQPLFLGNHI